MKNQSVVTVYSADEEIKTVSIEELKGLSVPGQPELLKANGYLRENDEWPLPKRKLRLCGQTGLVSSSRQIDQSTGSRLFIGLSVKAAPITTEYARLPV